MTGKIILSDPINLKYLKFDIKKNEIIGILSDIKHRIFPRPFCRESPLKERKGLIGVEIGVSGGHHLLSLLRNLSVKKIYAIDPYSLYEDYLEGKKFYGEDNTILNKVRNDAR